MAQPLDIFVVSDATGATAESVVTSVLLQFTDAAPRIRRFPFVRTTAEVQSIVGQAAAAHSIVVFPLVLPDLRQVMLASGRVHGVPVVDLIGPLMGIFAGVLRQGPSQTPGIHSPAVRSAQAGPGGRPEAAQTSRSATEGGCRNHGASPPG